MTIGSNNTGVSLVILAAGLGQRFGGDKALAEVGGTGKTLMHFSVMDAWRAGVKRLVLVISPAMEDTIRQQFLPGLPNKLKVELVYQRTDELPAPCNTAAREKPWGTGHALWCARSAVNGPMTVINADDYYGRDAMQCLVRHFELDGDWAMASYQLEKTLSDTGAVNRGLCNVHGGYLRGINECLSITNENGRIQGELHGDTVRLSPETPVSMNIWGFGPEVFGFLEQGLEQFLGQYTGDGKSEYYLPGMVAEALGSGSARVRVYPSHDAWFGMTYREDLSRLGPFIRALSGEEK